MAYKESEQGRCSTGISEGAASHPLRRRSSYSTHGEPMIPVYIFYSMFGSSAPATRSGRWPTSWPGLPDRRHRGRTTLTGEGLQHARRHSPLLALTNPAVVHCLPAFSY